MVVLGRRSVAPIVSSSVSMAALLALNVAGRAPSRARRPAAHTAAIPRTVARSATTGPGRPSSVRSQVIFDGQAFDP